MKILVVSQYYHPEQFRITDICETLVSLGHEVVVLTGLPNYPQGKIYPGYTWPKRRYEVISGVKVIRVPIIGRGNNFIRLAMNYVSFLLTATIKTLFLKKDFDIVFVYQLSPITMAIPALLYKKLTGKKVLLYCLDIWPESIAAAGIGQSSYIYKFLLAISRKIYKNVDRILVSSYSFIKYFKDIIGIELQPINYLPQHAEEQYYLDINHATREKGDKGTVNLLFAGNVGEMQSVETIIRAAAELRAIDQLKWHIVGDGSARLKCEELVKHLGLEDKVIFYGHRPVSEMPQFFSMASALLVTLKNNEFISYTLPGKVQSYMAAGKPIIGAINGEARRVIEESGCGLCCDAEDYKALANIVKQFISIPEKHKEFALNSRKYYEENFTKDIFIKGLLNNLNKLIERC
ncbi:glycosyltransferase family 4 protein [Saccharococcus caldoxylosilyticus]|uniref:glycosyltransferase family 4 protein n=1 Tax=Saccharococcus caldoxylosilyticus TaxID=81408 RepID=UPI001FCA8CD5|nr:glycosyltransferase family 4 protein [Parageobacillus caldoxylosilyticus]BDG37657.1 glycosyltransferase WbuB [Parageobacillus caldoxylosilyticus]BDG41449.1 glycosyltransferase WbuB [Parageobacillus caldoxylosilyticus]